MKPIRYKELYYDKYGPGLWRFIDAATGAVVGPQYATQAELLADVERYAGVFGCEGAERAEGRDVIKPDPPERAVAQVDDDGGCQL